jgi:hypothetical protein
VTKAVVVASFEIRNFNLEVTYADGHRSVFVVTTFGVPRRIVGISQLQLWDPDSRLALCYNTLSNGIDSGQVTDALAGYTPQQAAAYWSAACGHIGSFCPVFGPPVYDDQPADDDREYAQHVLSHNAADLEVLRTLPR